MSLFSVGGNIGFALGPLLASFFVITLGLGLDGGVFIALPGLIVAALLLFALPHLARFAPGRGAGPALRGRQQLDGTVMLLAIVGLRSLAHMGLFTFIPLYEISRGNSAAYGTRLLALFLFAGAIGTLLGGPLADRIGRRQVLLGSFIVSPPLILTYVLVGGAVGVVALLLVGMAVIGTFSVSLVMSQEYMPGRVGMASGLSIGLAIGLGGVAAVALGAVADALDLQAAVLATAPAPRSASCSLLLPPHRVRFARGSPLRHRRRPTDGRDRTGVLRGAGRQDGRRRRAHARPDCELPLRRRRRRQLARRRRRRSRRGERGRRRRRLRHRAPEDLFLRIVRGEQSPMGAFLMGKIRVEGDAALAMRLKDLLG